MRKSWQLDRRTFLRVREPPWHYHGSMEWHGRGKSLPPGCVFSISTMVFPFLRITILYGFQLARKELRVHGTA